ncbi:MAG: hypothetical protein ACI8PQ_000667 [Planctomycetota bacterium]|jgi:hypothetical protein
MRNVYQPHNEEFSVEDPQLVRVFPASSPSPAKAQNAHDPGLRLPAEAKVLLGRADTQGSLEHQVLLSTCNKWVRPYRGDPGRASNDKLLLVEGIVEQCTEVDAAVAVQGIVELSLVDGIKIRSR